MTPIRIVANGMREWKDEMVIVKYFSKLFKIQKSISHMIHEYRQMDATS